MQSTLTEILLECVPAGPEKASERAREAVVEVNFAVAERALASLSQPESGLATATSQ